MHEGISSRRGASHAGSCFFLLRVDPHFTVSLDAKNPNACGVGRRLFVDGAPVPRRQGVVGYGLVRGASQQVGVATPRRPPFGRHLGLCPLAKGLWKCIGAGARIDMDMCPERGKLPRLVLDNRNSEGVASLRASYRVRGIG